MRAVIQRVAKCTVTVDNQTTGNIGKGLLVLLGVQDTDTEHDTRYLADKVVNLRIFEDQSGKLNRSILEIAGEMLIVSQFTLLGDCRKGRRPSFSKAAGTDQANALYQLFCRQVQDLGVKVETGRFGAYMRVSLVNDGPVTLLVESPPSRCEPPGDN